MSDRGLVDAARELAEILEAENAALAAVDYAGAARLTQAKHSAADAFARASAARESPEADAAVRALALPQLAETNRRLLERALVVQRRVIQTFARAVPRTPAAPRYGANGTLTQATRTAPVALVARA
jgi:ribonuclease D